MFTSLKIMQAKDTHFKTEKVFDFSPLGIVSLPSYSGCIIYSCLPGNFKLTTNLMQLKWFSKMV